MEIGCRSVEESSQHTWDFTQELPWSEASKNYALKKIPRKKMSDETKQKMSIIRKGKIQNKNWVDKRIKNRRKPVLQYDLDGNFIKEWESSSEIINNLNLCRFKFFKYLDNNIPYEEFIWKRKNPELKKELSKEFKNKIRSKANLS